MKYPAVLLAVAGCSAIRERAALDSEELLAEAGFRREPLAEPGLPEPESLDLMPAPVAGR